MSHSVTLRCSDKESTTYVVFEHLTCIQVSSNITRIDVAQIGAIRIAVVNLAVSGYMSVIEWHGRQTLPNYDEQSVVARPLLWTTDRYVSTHANKKSVPHHTENHLDLILDLVHIICSGHWKCVV